MSDRWAKSVITGYYATAIFSGSTCLLLSFNVMKHTRDLVLWGRRWRLGYDTAVVKILVPYRSDTINPQIVKVILADGCLCVGTVGDGVRQSRP